MVKVFRQKIKKMNYYMLQKFFFFVK